MNRLSIVTYAADNDQERSVKALIKSIRQFGGDYRNSVIYVVLGDPENYPCNSLKTEGITLLSLDVDESILDYPYAIKAFAAARVEKMVSGKTDALVWIDPGVLVLKSPDELVIDEDCDVIARPVSLSNTISIPPGTEPNEYWAPIYKATGLDYRSLPALITIVDEVEMQPYYNCEVFSVNPKRGIFEEWARLLTTFIQDEEYQNSACGSFLRKIFLHQAVLSGVIASKVPFERIKPLAITSGYPFNQHDQLSPEKQVSTLNEISNVIFDYAWARIPTWLDKIPVDDPLKQWLFDTYLEYLQLNNNLYRIEGSCNSYLVTTGDGSVLIDPAGACSAPEYFKEVIDEHPLKAILLTHAHQDHWDNIDVWHTDPAIPIIAQREFNAYNEYRSRLVPFFARRGAIWGRKEIPDSSNIEPYNPPIPTITFADEYTHELGDFHFVLTHTPGETPDHASIWIPELQAVFVGDNYYEYFINNATLRGTSTRPILGYINALTTALSYEPEYFLMGHGRPLISKNVIKETVSNFRDALQYLNDETVKGINNGKDVYTLMREITLPDEYAVRPYYGNIEWTIRGIYHEYIGWFDENPASMYGIPSSSIYGDLVELCGTDALVSKAEALYDSGEYVKVLHITDVICKGDPDSERAKTIRRKALEALKANTRNYIERIWLDYGIRTVGNEAN